MALTELIAVFRDSFVEWYALGIAINVEPYVLNEIEMDNDGDISRCTVAMLMQWHQRKKPTWKKLVQGLLKIGMTSLAYTICRKFSELRSLLYIKFYIHLLQHIIDVKLPPNTFDKLTVEVSATIIITLTLTYHILLKI